MGSGPQNSLRLGPHDSRRGRDSGPIILRSDTRRPQLSKIVVSVGTGYSVLHLTARFFWLIKTVHCQKSRIGTTSLRVLRKNGIFSLTWSVLGS